ncbi:copper chaperone CopZ [Brevibacillus humidisoli]|uniref:copper chaperone CopZ n=1 Tax=Brevibacillus humidisoli TaxID=2895522 RepID=UPI001E5BF0F2|nr:copper chaperone CopZ [Brevibacillus humidisoli]UFJ40860.1 copper chaperone CopZ [Brevibacillus humidisoli]
MITTTLQVKGMSCNHCVNAIEGSVGKLAGVSSATVDLAAGEVTVSYDEAQIGIEKVKETIEEQGYDVV